MAKRDPTIEITPMRLSYVLDKVCKQHGLIISRGERPIQNLDKLIHKVCNELVDIRPNRKNNLEKDAYDKDLNAIAKSIYVERSNRRHRNNKILTAKNKSWAYLDNIRNSIKQFADYFDLEFIKSVNIYISLGFNINSGAWRLNKLSSEWMLEEIINLHEVKSNVTAEENNEIKDFYLVYNHCIGEFTGFTPKIKPEIPVHQYQDFDDARQMSEELELDYEEFTMALFDKWEWSNCIPTPRQMASERSRNYILAFIKDKRNLTKEDQQLEAIRKQVNV